MLEHDFHVSCGGTIAAGASAEFEIRFAPKEVEDFSAVLDAQLHQLGESHIYLIILSYLHIYIYIYMYFIFPRRAQ